MRLGDGYGGRSEVGRQSTRSRRFHRAASYSYLLCRTSPETVKSSSSWRVAQGFGPETHKSLIGDTAARRNLGGTWEEPGKNLRLLEPAGRATSATSQKLWSAWSSPARGARAVSIAASG